MKKLIAKLLTATSLSLLLFTHLATAQAASPLFEIKELSPDFKPNLNIKLLDPDSPPEPISAWVSTGLTTEHITSAKVKNNYFNNQIEIRISFNQEGTKLFSKITARNIDKPLGIFINEKLISSPTVMNEITEGEAIITGFYTIEEAQKFVDEINSTIPGAQKSLTTPLFNPYNNLFHLFQTFKFLF